MTPATNKRYPQYKDFEDFLVEKHAEQYQGLDDEMPDDFSDWLQDLDVDVMLAYADLYAAIRVVEEGQRMGEAMIKSMTGEVGGV